MQFSGAADRNKEPMLDVLRQHIDGKQGRVLEIASGTGQHMCFFAKHLPGWKFQPSAYSVDDFASIKAYTAAGGVKENVLPPAADRRVAGL
jgi:hypothetical protein